MTLMNNADVLVTMAYGFENRLNVHQQTGSTPTYLYDPDKLKRIENMNGAVTTILWNGPDYLQGRA